MKVTLSNIIKLKLRLQNDLDLRKSLVEIIDFLEDSEYLLVQLMLDNNIWTGTVPPPPSPTNEGHIEFGLIPYWVNHPPAVIKAFLDINPLFYLAWKAVELALPANIDPTNYDNLVSAAEGQGIVTEDGTIFGLGTYEQLDPNWVWSLVDYLFVKATDDRAQFSTTQVQPITLSGSQPNQVTIALVGDWGTGVYSDGQAVNVMNQIKSLNPDCIIHLGDAYYAGTDGDFPPPGEEVNNYLSLWPDLPSFMLNSNHEMYSGAKGYFRVLQEQNPFSQQQATSYFALQYGGWTILGLDSAYFDTSSLFMNGSLGGTTGAQAQWIDSLISSGQIDPQKLIVLTHHNGLSYDGKTEVAISSELNSILGGDPAAWYWGHIHNGIVYNKPTIAQRNTFARCVGHGAIPFGQAFGLVNDDCVAYYAKTINQTIPNNTIRVCNGFALLTIDANGSVTEEFYEQNTAGSVFSNSY
jgi:hypothetical protein